MGEYLYRDVEIILEKTQEGRKLPLFAKTTKPKNHEIEFQ